MKKEGSSIKPIVPGSTLVFNSHQIQEVISTGLKQAGSGSTGECVEPADVIDGELNWRALSHEMFVLLL